MTIQLAEPSCARCGRSLKQPVDIAGAQYGSTCARIIVGVKAKRRKSVAVRRVDPRQLDWVQEVRA